MDYEFFETRVPVQPLDPLAPFFATPQLDVDDLAWIDQIKTRSNPSTPRKQNQEPAVLSPTTATAPTTTLHDEIAPFLPTLPARPLEPLIPHSPKLAPIAPIIPVASFAPIVDFTAPIPMLEPAPIQVFAPIPIVPAEPAKVSRAEDPEMQAEKPRGTSLDTDTKRKKRGKKDDLTDHLSKYCTPQGENRDRKKPKRFQ
jgi:hypothetical protein